jgi:hypothetical protein
VLSFSEQAQEPWAPEIPVCVIRALAERWFGLIKRRKQEKKAFGGK